MTIYIPDDLKKRMDKISKKENVNWSALACAAFTEKLNALERERKGTTMGNVIERLRISKGKNADKVSDEGFEAGKRWAEEYAEAIHLERLEKAQDSTNDWGFGVGSSVYSSAQHFYFFIEPQNDGGRDEAAEFWEQVVGENCSSLDSDDFIQGFALGAMDVWYKVQNHI